MHLKQKYTRKSQKYCLNDNISLTGLAGGISINSELVKYSSLRLASRFFGMFAADSLIVSNEYSRLACSFCKQYEGYSIPSQV